ESVRPVISPPGNYVIEDVLDVVVCEAHGYIAVLYQSNTLGLFQLGDPSYSDIFIGAPPWAIAIAVSGQIAYDYTRGRVWQTVDIGSDGWGYFDLITLTFVTTIASGGGGVQYGCMYNPDMDAVIAVKDNVRTAFSAVDGSVVRVIGTPGAFLFDTKMLYLPEGGDLYAYGQTGTGTYRFYLSPLVTSQAITLREIVEDICMDGGLQINEVGATELTETVIGYLIAQKMTRRAAIEGLQGYGLFGGVESDTQITFPLRAGSSVRTLTEDDLVIDEDANLSAKPDYFSSRRIEEAELPKEVAITFINPLLHYDQSTIPARRLVTHSENLQGLEMAIAMSSDTAKQKAEILLNTAWAERTTHTFSLAYDNADLNPLDIITVQLDGDVFDMIIERTNLRPHNVIDITAKSTVSATYSNTSTASDPGSPPTDGVLVVSASLLFIADIPLLTDQSSGPGIYLFASPALESQTWNGANVYRSTDNSNWTDFTSIITPTPTGSVLDDSSAFPSNEFPIIDRVNTLRVMLSSGTLSSITEAELVEGKNAALWGREVIQYTTATLQGDGSYILSGIVRSRRGTEAFREHAWVGERFIVLNHPLSRPVTDPGERDTLMYYRVVSIGQKFINGTTIAHTNTEAGLKPYPPINIEAEWDNPSANDITFSWLERTRVGAQRLPTGTTIQSAEDIEEYEVDIIDDAGAVVRSITGLTTPAATYTAAQQTTDFGAVRDWVNIKAYQKSATVGRGFTVPAWFVGPDGDVIEEDFSSGTIGVSPTGWIDEWPGNSTFTVETDLTGVGGKVLKMLLGAASPSIEHAFSVPDSAYRHPQRNILARFKMDTSFGGAVPTGFALYLIANGERSDRSFNYARFVVRGDGTGWYLQRHTSGEVREIDSILTAYTFTLDEWYWVRAEVDGNVLRARVWKDDVGVVEPSGWEGEVRYARVISSGFVAVGAQDYFKSYYLDSIRIAYGGAYA
ncbi:MAG: phage tail protein, partial [Gammaproteobacteria bacterium]|nr:phage tail protein [Gammaproteobacteria bacterium]